MNRKKLMKKVISIVLALVMMLPVAAMLIPTASAANVVQENTQDSWVYYEQDFESAALAGKDDYKLADALGWSRPAADGTYLLQDGQLRIVNHVSAGGANASYSSVSGVYFGDPDSRFMTSVTVIEYDLTYQRRAKGDESVVVTGYDATNKKDYTKTIVADGQAGWQFLSLSFRGLQTNGSSNNGYIHSRVNLTGATPATHQAGISANTYAGVTGAGTWGANTAFTQVNTIPSTVPAGTLEWNNTVSGAVTNEKTTVMGMKMHVKMIVDPVDGNVELWVNDTLILKSTAAFNADLVKWAKTCAYGDVYIENKPGVDALLDNIKIWGYNSTRMSDVSPTGSYGRVYYENDFNDPALQGLEDDALTDAIGWSAPNNWATALMTQDGKLRLVSQYSQQGVYPPEATMSYAGWSPTIVQDEDIAKNSIVVEYKFTYNRRPANSEAITVKKKDGTEKVIKADGQGGYQAFAFTYLNTPKRAEGDTPSGSSDIGIDNMLFRLNLYGNGQENTLKGPDSPTSNAVWWKTTTITRLERVAEGDTATLEYYDAWKQNDLYFPAAYARDIGYEELSGKQRNISNVLNREYSVKIIVEPMACRQQVFVDGVLIDVLDADVNMLNFTLNDWNRFITDTIGVVVKPGIDVTVDDIKIAEYTGALNITEVMANGDIATASKTNTTGSYQWIEITNPTNKPVNVYDYAIHLWNMPTFHANIGTEYGNDEKGGSAYYVNGSSTLGYFTPGAKTLANGEVFNSPSYNEGVLQPGESAVVLFPHTAIKAGKSVTDTAFKDYLKGLNSSFNSKVFVADNKSDYVFALLHNTGEGCSVAIVKATNTATDGTYNPVANCINQPGRYAYAFAESQVILTSKTGGGTNYFGLSVDDDKSWNNKNDNDGDGFAGNIPLKACNPKGDYATNGDKSFEISYYGWLGGSETLKFGFAKYSPSELRDGKYATPGYVPEDCRRSIDVTVDGAAKLTDAAAFTAVTFDTPSYNGYDTQVWIDGKYYMDATAATMTLSLGSSADIEVKYYRDETLPLLVGYQLSEYDEENDTYSLRILAVVNDIEALDNLGFAIQSGRGSSKVEIAYEVGYVYEQVTVYEDGDATLVTPKDMKGYELFNYFYALHIENIPADSETVLNVKAISNFDVEEFDFSDMEGYEAFDLAEILG